MLLKVLLIFLFVTYNSAGIINHLECEPGELPDSTDITVDVTGCNKDNERCPLERGKSYRVAICFNPKSNYTGPVLFKVRGVFEGVSVPYGRAKNACPDIIYSEGNRTCTEVRGIYSGYHQCHVSTFDVSPKYPCVKLHVKFTVVLRRSKKTVCCVQVPVEIMDPPSHQEDDDDSHDDDTSN